MRDCQGCCRPMGRGWLVCGWCGAHQIAKTPKRGIVERAAGFVLLLQAVGLVAATISLAAVWATQGWTVGRGQTLGLIWFGVIILLGFIAWIAVNMGRTQERPLYSRGGSRISLDPVAARMSGRATAH